MTDLRPNTGADYAFMWGQAALAILAVAGCIGGLLYLAQRFL